MEPDPPTPASRRVEAYLDLILAPLSRRLSPFHRAELRRELREHLWARVDAYSELGQSEEEAVTEALRQFGGAEDFTRQWRREWAPQSVTLREVWAATRLALPLSVAAFLLACLPPIFAAYQMWVYSTDSWLYIHYDTFNHIWLCLIFLLPCALGLSVGQRAGRSAVLGMFGALATVCLSGCLVNIIGGYLWEQMTFLGPSAGLIGLLAAVWMPVSCTAAAVGGKWARRFRTRHLA